ncbi:MAG: galactokinase [Anaerolineae bacterium]
MNMEAPGLTLSGPQALHREFAHIFGHEPTMAVRAPGRVNLIGEHTDYNEGFVLPVAINRMVMVMASPRPDRKVHLYAASFGQRTSFSLDDIGPDPVMTWSNYQRGVALVLQQAGFTLKGMDALIRGDVPIGAGLSSSAAVEVATAYAFLRLGDLDLDRVQLALLCRRAENEFVGVNCGIMDQLVALLGRRGHALLIDCRSLEYQLVPIPAEASIVVADTRVRRGLLDSEYNIRQQQCQEGARLLGIKALRDISLEDFEGAQKRLPETVRRRCHHVVEENQRVVEAATALRRGDLPKFGQLMNESHRSLRDDYEVSCHELDLLAEAAWPLEGVYGSRMTGGGFGGCTVSLVQSSMVDQFREQVTESFKAAIGYAPEIYLCQAADGAGEAD